MIRFSLPNNDLQRLEDVLRTADDPNCGTGCRSRRDGPPGSPPPGHRHRPLAAIRPTLAQRRPGQRPRRVAAPQSSRGQAQRVKGHRPVVGTWDCKHLLCVFAVVHLVTAAVHANTFESPKDATKMTGQSKTRRMQEAFAAHLRHVVRMYPANCHPRVVLLIDNASWHRGEADRRGPSGPPAPGVPATPQL